MITIKDYMETVDYRITEGSDYLWKCFGPDAYRLEYWNGEHDGHSIGVVFDRLRQTVYQMEAHDYPQRRSYRWTHPDYVAAHAVEAQTRDVDVAQAYDDVNYVDISDPQDILRRSAAIVRGEPYDTRVEVPVEMTDEEWYQLMQLAHQRDITLNQLVAEILTVAISATSAQFDNK